MEHHSVSPLVLPSLPLTSALAFPDTPPLTPVEIAPKTPRKPAHPVQTVVSVSRGEAAIISFKLVQSSHHMSPSLKITSLAPTSKHHGSTARRRLWLQPGDTCEALSPGDPSSSRPPKQSPLGYIDGVDADDEMDGSSPLSSFSPPHSPAFMEAISEAAAKPSSSSYPFPIEAPIAREKKSPKSRAVQKSKTCASCKTKKTPLWRDSEDGTPYCNACGIRFKKYRFRCSSCLYIPRKDERERNLHFCEELGVLVSCGFDGTIKLWKRTS